MSQMICHFRGNTHKGVFQASILEEGLPQQWGKWPKLSGSLGSLFGGSLYGGLHGFHPETNLAEYDPNFQ